MLGEYQRGSEIADALMLQWETQSNGNTVKKQTAPPFEQLQYTSGPLKKISFTKLFFWRNSLREKEVNALYCTYLLIYLFVVLLTSHQHHFLT